MPKDTFYFPHDFSAANNPKISAMIQDHSAQGYGIFWYIIELLHQNDTHKLPLKPYTFKAIAKQMLTNVEQVSKFVNDCIEEYELLYLNDGFFYSDRVLKNIEKRTEISEKRSIAGKNSQKFKKSNQAIAEQMLPIAEQNPTKERKGKETTFKSSSEPPVFNDVVSYFIDNGYTEAAAKRAFDYYDGNNWLNKYKHPITNWRLSMSKVWFTPENLKPVLNIPKEERVKIDHSKMDLNNWK